MFLNGENESVLFLVETIYLPYGHKTSSSCQENVQVCCYFFGLKVLKFLEFPESVATLTDNLRNNNKQ